MNGNLIRKEKLSFAELEIGVRWIGDDIAVWVSGGDRPHIGSVVQAVPRMSLTGDGSRSATSSVLNLTGHKDEFLCRELAETICAATGRVTVCTGGFHCDGMTKKKIAEVVETVKRIAGELAGELRTVRT